MKIKIVPPEMLSTKTLAARDYVLSKFRVTIEETVETDYFTYLEAETSDQAQSMLEEMSDADLVKMIKSGNTKKADRRVTDRRVLSAVAEDWKDV